MLIEAEKRLFTVDEYHRICEADIFAPDERTELINGEIISMKKASKRHIECTNRATSFFTEAFGRRAIVSVQNAFLLNLFNEPVPDVVVLKPRPNFYSKMDLEPEHALLVVEISDTSFNFDRKIKLERYAASGVQEFWIEDLRNNALLVFRDPAGDTYETCITFQHGETVSPLAFPDAVFRVEDLLG